MVFKHEMFHPIGLLRMERFGIHLDKYESFRGSRGRVPFDGSFRPGIDGVAPLDCGSADTSLIAGFKRNFAVRPL